MKTPKKQHKTALCFDIQRFKWSIKIELLNELFHRLQENSLLKQFFLVRSWLHLLPGRALNLLNQSRLPKFFSRAHFSASSSKYECNIAVKFLINKYCTFCVLFFISSVKSVNRAVKCNWRSRPWEGSLSPLLSAWQMHSRCSSSEQLLLY